MEKREGEAQCVQWRRVAHVNFLKPYNQSVTARWLVMSGSVSRLQRKKRLLSFLCDLPEVSRSRWGGVLLGVQGRGLTALCFLMRFSPRRRLFMSASQCVLLIYKPSCEMHGWKKSRLLPCARRVVSPFLVFEFGTPGLAGRWGQRQAAPGADWEIGFGYGGAGHSPIGLKLFEWASLEQSQAHPPRRKPS